MYRSFSVQPSYPHYRGFQVISLMFIDSFLGEFGDVYKGKIKCRDGSTIPVAVKTLKVSNVIIMELNSSVEYLTGRLQVVNMSEPTLYHLSPCSSMAQYVTFALPSTVYVAPIIFTTYNIYNL